jgi:hypothetical protein
MHDGDWFKIVVIGEHPGRLMVELGPSIVVPVTSAAIAGSVRRGTKTFEHRSIIHGPPQGALEKRSVLSKVKARQGVIGHNVWYVLWFGLAAVIIVFAAVYLFYFH